MIKRLIGILGTIVIVSLSSCKKDELPKAPPMVVTGSATNITFNSVTIGGEITSDGNVQVTTSGVVYSELSAEPTIRDKVSEAGIAKGAFSVSLTNLDQGKTYNVRAFATNIVGTSYGSVITFTTALETVNFTYNGAPVTYGVIVSGKTGKTWLDRNLGASRTATSVADFLAFGDLFQRGRQADGHQLITWTSAASATPVNSSTSTTSSADNPSHSLFIYNNAEPLDWRIPQNANLWQGVNGVNNPCPAGWRVPTREEWIAEVITDLPDGFAKLKLTTNGWRHAGDDTNHVIVTGAGRYWSSTSISGGTKAQGFFLDQFSFIEVTGNRGNAYGCRCIKN